MLNRPGRLGPRRFGRLHAHICFCKIPNYGSNKSRAFHILIDDFLLFLDLVSASQDCCDHAAMLVTVDHPKFDAYNENSLPVDRKWHRFSMSPVKLDISNSLSTTIQSHCRTLKVYSSPRFPKIFRHCPPRGIIALRSSSTPPISPSSLSFQPIRPPSPPLFQSQT